MFVHPYTLECILRARVNHSRKILWPQQFALFCKPTQYNVNNSKSIADGKSTSKLHFWETREQSVINFRFLQSPIATAFFGLLRFVAILLQIFHSSLFSERQTYFTLRSFYTVFLRVQKCSRDVRVRFLTSSCNLREINYSNAEHERNKHSKKFLQKPGLYFLEKWYLKHFTFIFFRLLYCEAILLRVYNLSDTVSFSVPIRFTIF